MSVLRAIGSLAALFVGLSLFTATAWAHHSYAMFDRNRIIEITGTVTQWQAVNPHAWLDVVELKDGKELHWAFQGGGASLRGPLNQYTFKPGDKVTVTAWPLHDGRLGGYLLTVKLPDGRVLKTPGAPPSDAATPPDAAPPPNGGPGK